MGEEQKRIRKPPCGVISSHEIGGLHSGGRVSLPIHLPELGFIPKSGTSRDWGANTTHMTSVVGGDWGRDGLGWGGLGEALEGARGGR